MSNINQTAPRGQNPRKTSIGCISPLLMFVAIMMLIGYFLVVMTVLSFCSGASLIQEDIIQYSGTDGYIAVLHIEGAITSESTAGSLFAEPQEYRHNFLLSTIQRLASDNENKGILLYIDSPGGEVYATDELYLEILRYKDNTGRPVYAYCGKMAASGGYYIASAADQIFMNRNGLTGSIGVSAGTFIDLSGFLEEQGVRTTSIYVGDNKAMGTMFEEFTEEQREIYLSILQERYDQFVDVVVEGRPLTRDEVIKLSDGRVFSANQAMNLNLIDGVMNYEEARNRFLDDMGWTDETQFLHFQPEVSAGLADIFMMVSRGGKTDLETYISLLDIPFEGFAYYYEGPRF